MDDPVIPAKFFTHFMLPLFIIEFIGMIGMGVGILTGIVETSGGNKMWAWVLILLPVSLIALFLRWVFKQ